MRLSVVFPTAALAVALVVAGCSPTATATPTPTPAPTPPPDAPSVLAAASKASYPSKLEITVGGSFTSAGATTALPDKLLTIDVDTAAGTGSVHLAIPVSLLGADGAALTKQLGVTGDSITFDALYDGTAIYAKSPAMPFLVSQLAMLAAGVTLPTLTADTWAKLIDAATLKQLASSATGAVASAAPAASAATTDVKAVLDQVGASLTLGAQTTGAGGPANDVKLTVDPVKLQAYMVAHPEQFPSTQLSTISALGTLTSISADVLVDVATSRLEQASFSIGVSQNGSDVSFTAKVGIAEAPAGVSFATPSGAVDVPLVTIVAPLIQSLMSSGGLGLPIPSASTAP
jgi:hypothetical protein